ncbi:MAG: hypothetical protein HY959_12325 [Ignavibacteriae bacterium]|nr:hypothetical protein [Ignavibacteriota bacterium]
MSKIIKNNIILLIGLGIGMLVGFLYWNFIGCSTGSCPLTSNWFIMILYGGMMGGLIGNMMDEKIKKSKTKTNQ